MQPYNQVRRSDRAVEDEVWIRDLLGRTAVGYLATVFDGQPFLNSNLFVYDSGAHAIYLHTAGKGRTRTNIELEPRVCFTVSEMGRLLPAEVALEFSVEYRSVVVFGRASVVNDRARAAAALQKLLDKYFGHLTPGRDYRPPVEEELKRTTVIQVQIESWSGKQKEVGEFPGAFWYGETAQER
ncbi:MAG: pyridoxamine 5'-phosphate oxidase family protein [Anaerolineae bacterium]|nr:pyridoxamine 5'-phosphate oxidase family protein [Anaerolineae bacterium]